MFIALDDLLVLIKNVFCLQNDMSFKRFSHHMMCVHVNIYLSYVQHLITFNHDL